MKIVALDHVVLVCRDVDASLAFYTQQLGLEPVRAEEWRRGEVFFPSVRIDDTTIMDLLPGEPSGTNVDHFCLVLADDEIDAIASDPAFTVVTGPTDGLFGARGYARSLYISDPDRHLVELRHYK